MEIHIEYVFPTGNAYENMELHMIFVVVSLKDCLIQQDGRLLVLFLYASNEEMRLVR